MEKIVWPLQKKKKKKKLKNFLNIKYFTNFSLHFSLISLLLPQTSLHLFHITFKFLLNNFQFNSYIFTDFLCNIIYSTYEGGPIST